MPAGSTISLCDASCDCYHLIESLRQVTNWRKVVALLLSPCVIRAGVASAHAALHWQHVQHCTSIICMQHRTGSMCVCVQHRTGSMCVCAASYRQHLHPCILPSFSSHSPLILWAACAGSICMQHLMGICCVQHHIGRLAWQHGMGSIYPWSGSVLR